MEAISSDEMRRLEHEAIASGRVTGLELMERAGHGLVEAIVEEWPDLEAERPAAKRLGGDNGPRAVVLCGPGNNGGDGFVVARLLHARGWRVAVFFYGNVEKLPEDARANYDRWRAMGAVRVLSFPEATDAEQRAFCDVAGNLYDLQRAPDLEELPPFVVIDALFGIGLSRPILGLNEVMVRMDYLSMWRDLNNSRLVAVDLPSGLDGDSGEMIWGSARAAPFPVIYADLTVTFHALKHGHVRGAGPDVCGKIVVKSIGL